MEQGRLPSELSRLKMLRGAAAGVLHLHRKDVVHRDIRRANVLLGEGDRALLADMGLARYVRQDTKHEYTTGARPARWSAPVRRWRSRQSDSTIAADMTVRLARVRAPV